MHNLSCKVYPKERSYISGILPNNKRIEAPTEVVLNSKEFDLCRKQGTIKVKTSSGEQDISSLSFAEALKIATAKISSEAVKVKTPEPKKYEKPQPTVPFVKPSIKEVSEQEIVEELPKEENIVTEEFIAEDKTEIYEEESTSKEILDEDTKKEQSNVEIRTDFNNKQYKNKSNQKHKNNQGNK